MNYSLQKNYRYIFSVITMLSVIYVPALQAQGQYGCMMDQNSMGGMGNMGNMGMMHGYGAGGYRQSMMPGMGMGMGMMSGSPYRMLGLSETQRNKIREIRKNTRKLHQGVMEKMMDYSDELEDLYAQKQADAGKIGEVYKKIFELKRQLIESRINAHNQQQAVLTDAQREKLENWGGGMMRQGMPMYNNPESGTNPMEGMPHMMR